MNIVRYDPTRSIFSLPRWMDDFEDGFPNVQRGLKIHETDKNLIVEAVVAGVPAENVEVNIEDGVLTIKAESVKEEKTKEDVKSSSYQYYYTTALSGGEWQNTDAEVKHGVVFVTIPKAEAAKPKKVTVRAVGK